MPGRAVRMRRIGMDKVIATPEEAVADIDDGASVAIAGFGIGHRFPTSLIVALREKGAKRLCIVCNSLGAVDEMRAQLLAENHQIAHLIAAFSARPGMRSSAEDQIASGEMRVELVPQGVLVERLRAGAAGLAGFYSPVGLGTEIASGKEVREFDGRRFVFEPALRVDYALLRAHRADRMGNLLFRGGSQNFNPSFAKAARTAIVEVDEIVEVGDIPPERVGLPGVFVSRVTHSTIALDAADMNSGRRRRPAEARRSYEGKPALSRAEMAERAASLLPEGAYVNLGVGIPTLVSNYLGNRDVMLHAENGILGYGPLVEDGDIDPDVYNAGGEFVSLRPGASFFDSVISFEIARSGKLDAVVLGGYQVDEHGNLANWSTPEMTGGGIGGAMDLVVEGNTVIAVMNHHDSRGNPKLVRECTFPLTGQSCVDIVVTDLCVLRRRDGHFVLEEVAPGFTPDEVQALTAMKIDIADRVTVMGEG